MKKYFLIKQVLILLFSLFTANLFPQTFVEQTGIVLLEVSNSSVAWGDFDNDGYLDIILTGESYSGPISKIYRNNGNNTFTEQTEISLTGVSQGSVAWGDFDNDGYLDIVLTGESYSVPISKIYRNNGDKTFTEQTAISLPDIAGSVAWGDYDNDGNLDILLIGSGNSGKLSKIFHNNGDNTFTEQTDILLPGVSSGSVAWGDYNNDGQLDFLLTGEDASQNGVSKIYHNNGDNTFSEQTDISLTGVVGSSVAWGDYDNDGYLDILITGLDQSHNSISKIYHNNGNNTFSEQTNISLTGVWAGSVAWGDYDNDGYLDILITGADLYWNSFSKIYHNNGNNTFTELTSISLAGVSQGSCAWGDYDNDGDLDILLTGNDENLNIFSKIYRNEISIYNTKPSIPGNLQTVVNNGIITFKWDKATDSQTPANGLSYNLYVYESGQSNYKCPPHAFRQSDALNGKRLISKIGNIQWNANGYILKNLPPDETYYWSIQAIDGAYSGSDFASEQSFALPLYRPITNSRCISFTNIQDNQVTAEWVNGGGTNRAVFIKQGTDGIADPVDNTTYVINSLTPGGWKCIYNGTSNTTSLTELSVGTEYMIHICEYNGVPGSEKYMSASAYQNPALLSTVFTEQTGIYLPAAGNGSVTWGDYNNDGYLDVLVTGAGVLKIYQNNGDNTFTEQTGNSFTSIWLSSADWGDYDNDGYLDILVTGYNYLESSCISKIYHNNGNNTFTELTGIALSGGYNGSCDWSDYDNDGKLDILLTGDTNSGYISEIFKNDGNNTFTNQTGISLTGVTFSSVAWGDYNNDAYQDILLTGLSYSNSFSKLYRNNGNNTFSEQTNVFYPVMEGSIAWGDYDNDGYLDILLTGDRESKIYNNNGDNTFTEQTDISLPGVSMSSVAWGDYDNDGNLDILLAGQNEYGNLISTVYRNNCDNTFSEQKGICLPGVLHGSVTWGDYDKDADLDILLTGQDANGYIISKIFKNNCLKINKNPDPPKNITYEIQNKNALLKWDKVTTDETFAKSITYNIKIGRKSGTNDFITSQSESNGFREIVAMGNNQFDTTFLFRNPRWDTLYYASVQAIDNSFIGGAFSNEVQFKINPVQPTDLYANHISDASLMLKWKRGNGDRCIIFIKEGTSGTADPQNYNTYYSNPVFAEGSPLSTTGWYCTYKGEADSVLVSGLNPQKNYIIHAIEFQGKNGSEIYAPTTTLENIGVFSTTLFSEQSGISLAGVYFSSVAWGDYDNDGYLDLIITGIDQSNNKISKIYHNNGDNSFTDQTGILLPSVSESSVSWGDYNNDGFLDLIITGCDQNYNIISKIYCNNGDNNFTEQTDILLPGVAYGSVTWGDYNNDGYLDILLTGQDESYIPISKIYHNNGNNTFSELTSISLPGVCFSSVAWGDYDKDGYLDILLTGLDANYTNISKIYHNNGSNGFLDQTSTNLTGVRMGSVVWGDYNNNGELDIILTGIGTIEGNPVSKIYINKGNGVFLEYSGTSFIDIEFSSVSWIDYDNNGYLDILFTGYDGSEPISMLYHNNGNNPFTEETNVLLPGIDFGSVACGDYDNDGDVDILLSGADRNGGYVTKIYRNNLIMKAGNFQANAKPNTPTSLKSIISPGITELSWYSVNTDETPAKTMSYNLRYKLNNSIEWKFASHAADNGFRRVVAMGNVQLKNSIALKNLPSGTYNWQVQAVDQGYQGGDWSAINSFTIKNTQAFLKSDTVCQGSPTHFTDQSVSADGISSWKWDFKDGTTSSLQNPVYTLGTSGSLNVKLVITSNSGVKDSLEKTILVKPRPMTEFSATTACQGSETTIQNNTNTAGLNITSWSWDYGDGKGSTFQNPVSHGYLTAGDYQLTLIAAADNGCADTIMHTVSVGTYPVAAITASTPLTFCSGDSVALSVQSNARYSYNWKLKGTSLTGGNTNRYVARSSGNYSVEVVNSTGSCKTTSTPVIVAAQNAPSAPIISAGGPMQFCQGDSVILSVTNTSRYTYQWKLNGGAVGTNSNQFVAKNSGDYIVVVSNSTGCIASSTNTINVVVNTLPEMSAVSLNGPTTFCKGGSITLGIPSTSGYSYNWRNEDGLIASANINTYNVDISGNYQLDISNSSGCIVKTLPINVVVKPMPLKPLITSDNYQPGKCLGETPVTLKVNDIVSGVKYQWYMNHVPLTNGASSFVEGFISQGDYTVEADLNGCKLLSDSLKVYFEDAPEKPLIYAIGPTVWYLACSNDSATKYKWYYNGSLIPGAEKYLYVANQKLGKYNVSIANAKGCFSVSDTLIIPTVSTGIEDVNPFAGVKIYPNPTTGLFTVEMDNPMFGELKISILNQGGKQVLKIKFEKTTEHFSSQIDLSGQSKGMYIINLMIDKYQATRKLVVN